MPVTLVPELPVAHASGFPLRPLFIAPQQGCKAALLGLTTYTGVPEGSAFEAAAQ